MSDFIAYLIITIVSVFAILPMIGSLFYDDTYFGAMLMGTVMSIILGVIGSFIWALEHLKLI